MTILPRTILALTFSLLAWGQTSNLDTEVPHPEERARLKVAVDAGHGGEDRGAFGAKGLLEKDVVLDLARDLRPLLEEAGFDVLMVRSKDTFIPLWDRARIANEAGADLFVSLHLNASKVRSARGSEVYFLSLHQGDADAAEVAARENAGAEARPPQDSVLSSILEDLAQKAYLQESERLAETILSQLNRLGGIRDRGVRQAPFAVLRGAAMPAVLVEAAFVSNPKEEAKLRDHDFRRKIAEAIARGIRRYFSQAKATPRRRAADGHR